MTHIRTVRHSKMSLFQSLIDDVILKGLGQRRPTLKHPLVCAGTIVSELVHSGEEVPETPPDEIRRLEGGPVAWSCVKLASELFLARLEKRHRRADELESELKDSLCDPGWVEVIIHYVGAFDLEHAKIPYVTWRNMEDFVLETLPPDATVALVGDWGSGTEFARTLLKQIAGHEPDALVHLGDIYYSGTSREMSANFLDICNECFDRSRGRPSVYTLCGNHDVYSGGSGYYALLPKLNPPPAFDPAEAQPASFFCLRSHNGGFQLLAMDTGLNDHNPFTVSTNVTYLEPSEAAWHLDKINRFDEAGGKTILLSHHQLFSAYEMIGHPDGIPAAEKAFNPKLLATFREALDAEKVSAWFWGHEHNLCIYEPYPPLRKGRCIGHGAIPVFQSEKPYRVKKEIPDPPQLVRNPESGQPLELSLDEDAVYRRGYVIIRFDDANMAAEASYYIQGTEKPIFREALT